MTQTYEAIYDGIVFRPEKPVQIKPNTRVQIVVEVEDVSNKTVSDAASHLFEATTIANASAWEDWTKSHSQNTVIIDDSRENIYKEY
jgi:predicted DNA-binding antitoxin AbrB/MazE fold protein